VAQSAHRFESPRTFTWTKPIIWLLASVAAVVGIRFFLFAAAHYLIDFSEASYAGYFPNRVYLFAHIAGGSLALLSGPFQIWSGLRRRVLKAHRVLGIAYVSGVVIGSLGALYMAAVSTLPTFAIALSALTTAWLVTTGMAFLAIKKRRIDIHKEWMIRSYVVTYGFVSFRLVDELAIFAPLGLERLATTAWLCWTIPLLFAEVALQWKRTVGARG
jgi:hypothetical protein